MPIGKVSLYKSSTDSHNLDIRQTIDAGDVMERVDLATGARYMRSCDHHCGHGSMRAASHIIERETAGDGDIIDLTDELNQLVAAEGIRTGQVTAMVIGSTAALSTLEYEPGLVQHDVVTALERIAPERARYMHEETWHDDNGHSHVRACLIGPSLALPVIEGGIPLGTWQQVVLIDLDTRRRRRKVAVVITGE